MSLHTISLFLHVSGALAFGAGTFMALFSLLAMRRAQRVEQVRSVIGLLSLSGPILGIGMLVNVLTGLSMTAFTWGWQTAWIIVAIGTLVLFIAAGAVMGTRRGAIAKQIGDMPDGPLPESVVERIHDPLFGTSVYMMLALLLGIVFLMTAKPALDGSIVAIVAAAVLGALASLPLWRERAGKTTPAELPKQSKGQP